jgi:hypothetical protein
MLSITPLQTRQLAFRKTFSKTIVGKQGIFGERIIEIHKEEIIEVGWAIFSLF